MRNERNEMMKKQIKHWYTNRTVRKERIHEEEIILNPIPAELRTPLTDEEKRKVDETWHSVCVGGVRELSYKELEVFKYFNGFDQRYLGHNLYLPLIARRLNNYHYTKMFEDKSLLGHLSGFSGFPQCLVRCISGEYYNYRFEQISKAEACELICMHGGKVVFKVARESSGGHGVQMLDISSVSDAKSQIQQKMDVFGSDYVVQGLICQHESMAKFNPSSVNSLRIWTLYLNGRVSLCGVILRIGKENSFVDNMCSGGMGIGVDRNGNLRDYGYDYACHKIHKMNGIEFKGMRLKPVPEIIDRILEIHKNDFSLCKFIGWDVCLDKDGVPLVIELNSSQPEIFVGQLNNGPIFGDRTEEVIDFVSRKEFKYGKGLFNI